MGAAKQGTSQGQGEIGSVLGKPKSHEIDLSSFDIRTQHDGFKPSAIGAKAFTEGNDVAFKGGAEPTQGLIGHEAAHVVQQRPAKP